MSPPLSVDVVAAQEIDRVAPLWRALLVEQAALQGREADADAALLAWRRRMSERIDAGSAALFAATRDGAPVGLCGVERAPAPAFEAEAGRAEITELFVAPAARRAGIGRALVGAALDWIRAASIARVEVRVASRNAEGQAFWRALGWGDSVDVLERRL